MNSIDTSVPPWRRPKAAPAEPQYRQDAQGRLVPVQNIKPEHLLEDEMVRALVVAAEQAAAALAAFKARAFTDLRGFVALLEQQYGTKMGGRRGNMTFTSYDGALRIQLAIGDHLAFGPELQIAKSLIDDCIRGWSEGANVNLRTIVMDAFQVDKEGRVSVDRILGLRRLEIEDAGWKLAMNAIGDAVRVVSSKEYVRFYRRAAPDKEFEQVPLDFARV